MPPSIDDLIPNAKQIQKEAALKEAEKAEEYARIWTWTPRITPDRELQAFHCRALKAPTHSSRKISNRQPRSSALAFTKTGAQFWIGTVGGSFIVVVWSSCARNRSGVRNILCPRTRQTCVQCAPRACIVGPA